MISPWTIYQEKKQSPSINQTKTKKLRQNQQHGNKKSVKNDQIQSVNDTLSQYQKIPYQQQEGTFNHHIKDQFQQNKINEVSSGCNKSQCYQIAGKGEINDIQKQQNQYNTYQNGLGQQSSKQFLKNILQDHQYGSIDNNKLLDFCKGQSNSSLINKQVKSPNKRRPTIGQRLIQDEKQYLFNCLNFITLLKYIKETLKKQESIQKQIQESIQKVLDKLNAEFVHKISPEEQLLQKLLKNQKEKHKYASIKNNPQHSQSTQIRKNSQDSPKNIMSSLQQDIQKSSIIKYANSSEFTYLQQDKPNLREKSQKKPITSSKKIQFNVSNQKLTDKLIYVGKKNVINRHHQSRPKNSSEGKNKVDDTSPQKYKHPETQNPETLQLEERSRRQHGKQLIEQLIKQHMVLRESKKIQKQSKNLEKSDKVQIQSRKLKASIKIFQNTLANTIQSNLINSKLEKNRIINPINDDMGQNNDKKQRKHSNLSLSSPLMPPQFELPRISPVKAQSAQKNLSSSSKLLEMISNNILASKNKGLTTNSASSKKGSIIDKLFIKDKQKKQMRIRRNYSVNSKGNKSESRIKDRKNLLSLDEQIKDLFENDYLQKDHSLHKIELSSNDMMERDFLSQKAYDYNFTRKKSKLSPLQTELIQSLQSDKKDLSKQNSINQMNSSQMKFSDHQIISEINHASISSKR